MSTKTPRIRAADKMFAADYVLDFLGGLRAGRTVTKYLLEPPPNSPDEPAIEFEIVVTGVGGKRLPRVTEESR